MITSLLKRYDFCYNKNKPNDRYVFDKSITSYLESVNNVFANKFLELVKAIGCAANMLTDENLCYNMGKLK